ncbi:MAG: hypothetical protein JXA90_04375 [Planctomycetes bacterium]|nr:hypothetical protein [Planctomycetota bacterium]
MLLRRCPLPLEPRVSAAVLLIAIAMAAAPAGAQSVADLSGRGIEHFNARQYHQAIEAFEKALQRAAGSEAETIRKNLASALGALGAEYFNSGESKLAEDLFLKGLEQADNYYSHFGLGYLYMLRREDDAALLHLEAALSQQPRFAGTYKLLALVDYRQGKNDSARERMEEAVRLDPRDAEAEILLKRWRTEARFLKSFRDASTSRFALRIDPEIPSRNVAAVTAALQKAYQSVGDGLGLWPSSPTSVILFADKNFYEATGSYHWVGGMYDGQLKLPVPSEDLSPGPLREKLEEVIRHEYAHVLIAHLAPECPVWINEGIAQHFERPGERERIYAELRGARDRRIPLDEIPARLWAVSDVELARWSYREGLAFVEFLVERYGEFRLRLLLGAMAEEHSVERAFARTYGLDRAQLEERFWREIDSSPAEQRQRAPAADGEGPSSG